MSQLRTACLIAAVPAVLLLATRGTLGEMSGDRGRPIVMQGVLAGEAGQDRCRFSVEIERVGFVLNTVQGKYRLARLRFENMGAAPVVLSVDRDRLDLELSSGAAVPAILNLQRGDSAFWDALSAEMRQVLAYPQSVKARTGGAGGSPEVIYVYAMFPADKVTEVPRAFTYRIDSVGQPVRIEHRATAARP